MSAIRCHRENDTFIVELPSTVLFLTEDEAEALHKEVFVELFNGMISQSEGNYVSEQISIASDSVSRPEAWALTKCMEEIWSPSDDDISDHEEGKNLKVGLVDEPIRWQSEGF